MKKHIIPIFIITALLQLSVPAYMAIKADMGNTTWAEYKFKTAPVDPYDAFRGRYVQLRFTQNTAPTKAELTRGQVAYALMENDAEGFAVIKELVTARPAYGAYVKCKVSYGSGGTYHYELPFDKYFMNEEDAPAAEKAYRENSGWGGPRDAYVTVGISDKGESVLKELYVGGKAIKEYIKDLK